MSNIPGNLSIRAQQPLGGLDPLTDTIDLGFKAVELTMDLPSMVSESSSMRNLTSGVGTTLTGVKNAIKGPIDFFTGKPNTGVKEAMTGYMQIGTGLLSTVTSVGTGVSDMITTPSRAFLGGLQSRMESTSEALKSTGWEKTGNTLSWLTVPVKVTDTMMKGMQIVTGGAELLTYPEKVTNLLTGDTPIGVSESSQSRVQTSLGKLEGSWSVSEETRDMVNLLTSLKPPEGMSQDEFISEIFHGAHVVVSDDGGRTYGEIAGHSEGYDRVSSHYDNRTIIGMKLGWDTNTHPQKTTDKQKGIDLPFGLGHLLVGTRSTEGGGKETWFQIEAHGDTARESIQHGTDFVLHLSSGKSQVAPFGYSTHSEKNQVEIVSTRPG
ncbi:hypothetical protein AYO49_04625 [Verrucomicrobiaceae bacterium SCGC AG-212-N21]|nr:hypothetical protein AYO49_04625 [Verrucomicrobiaceae bacterium SCGC AG-212-N21]